MSQPGEKQRIILGRETIEYKEYKGVMDVFYRKSLHLATGKSHRIIVPPKLFVKSVEPHKLILFGETATIVVADFDRDRLPNENPEITWELQIGNESWKLVTNEIEIKTNETGQIYFGRREHAKYLDPLTLKSHEFSLAMLDDLKLVASPYIKQKDPRISCNVSFSAKQLQLGIDRRNSIVKNAISEFCIREKSVDDSKPFFEKSNYSEVDSNLQNIEQSSKNYGLEPDFVKAIIYMETTHGWYDRYVPRKKSIRPMNIHYEYWNDLGVDSKKLLNPFFNIQIGCLILSRIWNRVRNPDVRKVASIYNFLGAAMVTDYGGRVGKIYQDKLWLKR